MTDKLKALQNQYSALFEEKESVQSKLGQRRMFHPDGTQMNMSEFTIERKKLKDAWAWRMSTLRKLKEKIRAEKASTSQPTSGETRKDIIAIAFSLICKDAAADNIIAMTEQKDVAEYYQDLARCTILSAGTIGGAQ